MKQIKSIACAALMIGSFIAQPAAAQTASCPGAEAKTASGQCVNPGLSSSLRLRTTLLSQAKISQTAFPIPPTQDRLYPRPNEYNRYELIRGIFSTNPDPFSCHPNCGVTITARPPIIIVPVVTTAR